MTGCLPNTYTLYIFTIPIVIFYQLAAPLMLFKIGDDSAKGTPFLTDIMNFMQLKYMYSSEWFYITECFKLRKTLLCEYIKVKRIINFQVIMKLLIRMAKKHNHLIPILHGFLLVKACI